MTAARALSLSVYTPDTQTPSNVVAMPPQLRVGTRHAFRELVQAKLDAGTVHVVIDCSGTGYVDSSGWGVLISLAKKARELGGSITLRSVNADVRAMLEITRIDTVLRIER